MAAETKKADPPEVNPFDDLTALLPELDTTVGELWHHMLAELGVQREHELHTLNDACADAGCRRLLAVRAYIREYSSYKAWQRWQAREQKKELREFLKKFDIAAAPERWDFKGERTTQKLAALKAHAQARGPQVVSLFNQCFAYLRGQGAKPEVK
jgi:hypothetical protein